MKLRHVAANSPIAYHEVAHQAIVAPQHDLEDQHSDSDSVGSTVFSVQGPPEPNNGTSTLGANASDLDSLS